MAVYFIVGGSSGIGLAISQRLVQQGHEVYATYHLHAKENSERLRYYHLNVLDDSPPIDFLPEQLDGLVYCPGSIQLRPFTRFSLEDFVLDYRLNVLGAVKMIQASLPKLKRSASASIVLFSSVAVKIGLPFHSVVSSSKGALEGLAQSLAAELAPHIRVNCVAPIPDGYPDGCYPFKHHGKAVSQCSKTSA